MSMINGPYKSFLFFGLFIGLLGCSGENMDTGRIAANSLKKIDQISKEKWESLARKKIFFGHQSVGNNIIDGIEKILTENNQIDLNVVETREISRFQDPIFGHSSIGKNDYPLTKVDDFFQLMNNGLGNNIDIAFLKYCFVDITAITQIQDVFEIYKERIEEVKTNHPNVTIVHFTVPLLKQQEKGMIISLKNFIKDIMGKAEKGFYDDSHNVARNEYNKMLLNYYSGKEPVFDIAKFESTYPSGERETFTIEGKKYFSLVPDYTDDGGHLNEKGRTYLAEQLLIFLATM